MRILVDADGCPVVKLTERIAKEYSIPVVLLCDTNHILSSDYSDIIVVSAGADAVDLKLINLCNKGDIVVTQDYGVAALALGKGAFAIHQNGKIYSDDNIEGLLMSRHIAKKARLSKGKHHLKGPKKRTQSDDEKFESTLRKMISEITM